MSAVTITHALAWRSPSWDADLPAREAWFVTCPDHPHVGKDNDGEPWGYHSSGVARSVRTKHINRDHK